MTHAGRRGYRRVVTTFEQRPGDARSSGPTVQDLYEQDSRPVPQALRDTSTVYQGSADVPRNRYTSPEFAALEAEYLWKHTWQFACREEDIPDKGDHVVYDVADESLIVTRTADGYDQGVPQLLPPPRHEAAGRGRPGGVVPLPVPRLAVEPRRHPHRGARPSGTSRTSPRDPTTSCLPQAQVATWRGLRVREPRLRTPRRSRSTPAS